MFLKGVARKKNKTGIWNGHSTGSCLKNVFLKSGFQSAQKREICRQESWLKSEIIKVRDDKKSIFNLHFYIIHKGATSQQMCYILASSPLLWFLLWIETTTVARFLVISNGKNLVLIFVTHICAGYIYLIKIISRIYKALLQLNKKANYIIKKRWPKTCKDTSQKMIYEWPTSTLLVIRELWPQLLPLHTY